MQLRRVVEDAGDPHYGARAEAQASLSDEFEAIARVDELELRGDDAIVRLSEVHGVVEHGPALDVARLQDGKVHDLADERILVAQLRTEKERKRDVILNHACRHLVSHSRRHSNPTLEGSPGK